MAVRILGLDLGASAVKAVVAERTLRTSALVGYDEEPLAPLPGEEGDGPATERALVALLKRIHRAEDAVVVALPGDRVHARMLSFPFDDPKRIAEVVGFELENHLPVDLDGLVFDHVITKTEAGKARVLAVAAPKSAVSERVDLLKRAGIEARSLGFAPLGYGALWARLRDASSNVGEAPVVFVDLGRRRTTVTAVQSGRPIWVRQIARGTASIAREFARQFDTDPNEAEALLRTHALLLPEGERGDSSDETRLDEATRIAVEPWLRDVRASLIALRSSERVDPACLFLCGGGARIRGLVDHVERGFVLPCSLVKLGSIEGTTSTALGERSDEASLAAGLALSAALRVPDVVDFRQGALAYEGDMTVVRQRLPRIALFAVVLLTLAGIRSALVYRGLVSERNAQVETLRAVSKNLLGAEKDDYDVVLREMAGVQELDHTGFLPELTSFRAFFDVTRIQAEVSGHTVDELAQAGGKGDTTTPTAAPGPPGPADERPPQPGRAAPDVSRDPAFSQGLRNPGAALQGVPGRGIAPLPERASAPAVPVALDALRSSRTPPPGAEAVTDAKTADAKADVKGDAKPPEAEKHFIELSAAQVDRKGATLRGDANTQDALLAFQSALEKHPCFKQVKPKSDRITQERHRDWYAFTVQFQIECSKKKSKAGKGAKDEAKEGGKETSDAKDVKDGRSN